MPPDPLEDQKIPCRNTTRKTFWSQALHFSQSRTIYFKNFLWEHAARPPRRSKNSLPQHDSENFCRSTTRKTFWTNLGPFILKIFCGSMPPDPLEDQKIPCRNTTRKTFWSQALHFSQSRTIYFKNFLWEHAARPPRRSKNSLPQHDSENFLDQSRTIYFKNFLWEHAAGPPRRSKNSLPQHDSENFLESGIAF